MWDWSIFPTLTKIVAQVALKFLVAPLPRSWMTSNRKPRGIRSIAFKSNSIASTKKSYRRRNRMLSQAQRTTILELNAQQVSKREIARVMGISRVAVRKVLRSNSTAVPELHRTEKAEPHRQQILELFDKCKGNLVRVHEELVAAGAELSYTALTAFCRRHGIGYAPPAPAGRYDFSPGEELQHDTSPHDLELGGKKRRVQTASAVLCYSRMLFFQCYPTFRRFDCKVFLTEALRYFGGAAARTMNGDPLVLQGGARDGSRRAMLGQQVLHAVDAEPFPLSVGEQYLSVTALGLAQPRFSARRLSIWRGAYSVPCDLCQ